MKQTFSLILALLLMSMAGLQAQVRIGGLTEPATGAILDLNSTTRGGLLLSNVSITNLDSIPANPSVFPGIATRSAQSDVNPGLTGMIVYNTNTDTGAGLYIWDGEEWSKLASGGSVVLTLTGGAQCFPFPASGNCTNEYTASDPSYSGQGVFTFTWISGENYIDRLDIRDAGAGEISVRFLTNDRASSRQAILLVTSPCGNSNTFVFIQDGDPTGCNTAATAPKILDENTTNLCTGGASYLYLQSRPDASSTYIWTLNGEEVGRGTEYIATQAGKYIVYANKIGCTVYKPDTAYVSVSTTGAPAPVNIIVNTNNGIACAPALTTQLISAPATSGNIYWYKNGIKQPTGTYNGTTIQAGAGSWQAVVENGGCSSTLSPAVTVTENTNPATIPLPQLKINGLTGGWSFCKDGSAYLEVANYNSLYTYNWYADNTKIGEGTGVYYPVPSAGSVVIRCQATGTGCAIEANVNQSILTTSAPPAPTLTGNPILCSGTTSLTANTEASSPSFTWFKDEVLIGGAVNSTYTVTGTGSYKTTVTSAGCTSKQSLAQTVSLSGYTNLTWMQNLSPVENGSIHIYQISGTNNPTSYTWTVDGDATIVNGQGSPLIQVRFGDPGVIAVYPTVGNACGPAINQAAIATNTVTVENCPTPEAQTPATNQTLRFAAGVETPSLSVNFTNTSRPTYRWYKQGTGALSDGSGITGTDSQTLNFNPLTQAHAGVYYCTVTNGCGVNPSATSNTFTLTVDAVTPGMGTLSGRVCFDIAETEGGSACGDLSGRSYKADFATMSTTEETYTYTPASDNVRNVRFVVVDPEGCVDHTSDKNPVPGSLPWGSLAYFTLYYKTTLNNDNSSNADPQIRGRSRDAAAQVTVYVIYTVLSAVHEMHITIKIQDCSCCGAMVSSTEWKAFMCHNLGADESANPFTPGIGLLGAFYQWGRKDAVANAPHAAYPNSSYLADSIIGIWGSGTYGSWSETSKAEDDPCPSGWRVPTKSQWAGVRANNHYRPVGKWSQPDFSGMYTSGGLFGSDLFLPAAGNRTSINGELYGRGWMGHYWSTSPGEYYGHSYLGVYEVSLSLDDDYSNNGMSIRCISE